MKNRTLKWSAAIGAIALMTGAVVTVASAHIGASHTPYTTEEPDLVSATIEDEDVQYCFDQEIVEVTNNDDPSQFKLSGYDSVDEIEGDSVELTGDRECVTVGFNDAQAIEEFTIASVDELAVEDRDNHSNIEGSVALTGSERGDDDDYTDAPNLVDFEADDDAITYTFDQNITCPANPAFFGYYSATGARRIVGATLDCEDDQVEVSYIGATPDADDAVRAFVEENAVCGEDPADDNCNTFEHSGANTDAPDLVDAERTDDDEFLYTFDEEIENITASSFYITFDDGRSFNNGTCTDEGEREVECVFAVAEDADDEEIALASVAHSAVDDDDASNQDSTVGDQPLGPSKIAPGLTDGPDLESCSADKSEDLVTYLFDEHVGEGSTTAGAYDIFDARGNMSTGTVDEADEEARTVTVEFDADALSDAVGCHVDRGAVDDPLGQEAPQASVGMGGAAPTTTAGTTTGATTQPTTSASPTPVTKRAATTLTIDYTGRKFTGTVGSAEQECQVGRPVTVKKRRDGRDRVIGVDENSGSDGTWNVPRRRARRGRYYAQVPRKVFTEPDGDTVICLGDRSPIERVRRRR